MNSRETHILPQEGVSFADKTRSKNEKKNHTITIKGVIEADLTTKIYFMAIPKAAQFITTFLNSFTLLVVIYWLVRRE